MMIPHSPLSIVTFQKLYKLTNREMAELCSCSLPTIQKWRSGEVGISGCAQNLLKLLHAHANGNPLKLRDYSKEVLEKSLALDAKALEKQDLQQMGKNVDRAMDRLELMLHNKRQEKSLLESEARYRSMVEGYSNPVCRWKPDTTITYANKSYNDLYSPNGESVEGMQWIDWVPAEKRQEILIFISDMTRRGIGQVYQHNAFEKGGKNLYHEWQDFPIKDEKGKVVEFHSVGRDLTDTHNLQRSNQRLQSIVENLLHSEGTQALIVKRNLEVVKNYISKSAHFRVESSLAEIISSDDAIAIGRLIRRLHGGIFIYRVTVYGVNYLMRFSLIEEDHTDEVLVQIFQDTTFSHRRQELTHKPNKPGVDYNVMSPAIDNDNLTVEENLKRTAYRIGAVRAYIFMFNEDKTAMVLTHQWCEEGLREHLNSNDVLSANSYRWFLDRIFDRNWVYIEDTNQMAKKARPEQYYVLLQQVCALISCPLVIDGELIGFVGFDHVKTARLWHDQEKAALSEFVKLTETNLRNHKPKFEERKFVEEPKLV